MTHVTRINLALQGGGAHGAFTWGVLDALLDREDIEVAGISGTSAGALNGAAFKSGMVEGGRDGARATLDRVWAEMAGISDFRMAGWLAPAIPANAALTSAMQAAVPFAWLETLGALSTPYAYGPFYRNPLAQVVDKLDCGRLGHPEGPALHVCATNVRTGKVRVFSGDQVTPDAILASACLPEIFQAVEIEDAETGRVDPYWDGGYSGNPALFPLFDPALPRDIVVVQINPMERDGTPRTPEEIHNRLNEITMNSSLLRELRAIDFVRRLLAQNHLPDGMMKDVLMHVIADDALMGDLSVRTKLAPSPVLLVRLKEAGRAACQKFLDTHGDKLGREASLDLRATM